jgi:hypothetical protein
MARQSENLQPSLFEDETPCAVLAGAQMVNLAALAESCARDRDSAGKRGDRR